MNEKTNLIGKTVYISSMAGEPSYNGKSGIIQSVDSLGQLHGTWGGCAIIPELDRFKIEGDTCDE